MSRIQLSQDALDDLRRVMDFIAIDNDSAARSWFASMSQLFEILASQPSIGERQKTRRLGVVRRISRGNYVVFFRPLGSGIVIVRILHGAQDSSRLL